MSTPSSTNASSISSLSSPSRNDNTAQSPLSEQQSLDELFTHSAYEGCYDVLHHGHLQFSEPGKHADTRFGNTHHAPCDESVGPEEAAELSRLFIELDQVERSTAPGPGNLDAYGIPYWMYPAFQSQDDGSIPSSRWIGQSNTSPTPMPRTLEQRSLPVGGDASVGVLVKRKIDRATVDTGRRTKQQPFLCSKCHTKFGRAKDLERHRKDQHMEGRVFVCGSLGCLRRNRRKDKMMEHCRTVHGNKPGSEVYN